MRVAMDGVRALGAPPVAQFGPESVRAFVTRALTHRGHEVTAVGDGDAASLFHMQTNLRFGCVILRHYLDRERGDLFLALGRYNGSRGKPQYPNAVFAMQRNWVFKP